MYVPGHHFPGGGKVNIIGIKQANKCTLMAGMAYNLKKIDQIWNKNAIEGLLEGLLSDGYMLDCSYLLRLEGGRREIEFHPTRLLKIRVAVAQPRNAWPGGDNYILQGRNFLT